MTDTDYNGYPIVNKGDTVQLLEAYGVPWATDSQGRLRTRGTGTNGYGYFVPGQHYPVTQVTTHNIRVRVDGGYEGNGTTVDIARTYNTENPTFGDRTDVHYYSTGPVDPNAPRPRKLGDTPEGDHLPISDPRIQWIWADLETYANGKNWCPEYDKLAAAVQIPGRMRSWKAERIVSGITIRANYKARSQAEADAMLAAELPNVISGLLTTTEDTK